MTTAGRPIGTERHRHPEGIAPSPGVRRRRAMLMVAGALCTQHAGASVAPPDVRAVLPSARLSGSTRFTYWGFAVYDASLWVLPGFQAQDFHRHPFALQLQYLRDFSNAAITKRSIDEMARQSAPTPAQRVSWEKWLRGAFPDVRSGDSITGINRPGDGAAFLTNGQQTGMVPDAAFARQFFGIWLAAETSEPAMRMALLSGRDGS